MVSVGLCILETIAAVETIFRLTQQYGLLMDKNVTQLVVGDDVPISFPRTAPSMHHTSIHHYAMHGLCRNFEGKKKLYKAMKTKLCQMKLSFIAEFVLDLCRGKHALLTNWVGELFDIDGDGYITHFEKHSFDDV
ncbi:uncharacterized protein LOC132743198 [Ruditapes philippinarum]|uniref:uncharacterized protein LOC132743198 n=1 Tax=Ruditapes philippinarum TaxID=129788 RepID=UPI00295C0417|nr:uncharacterized protein LOC132743198 [Ruditapes philippinarum]